MNVDRAIEWLDRAWDLEHDGFFYKLRQGQFDISEFRELVRVLKSIEPPKDDKWDKKFVTLVWIIPLFMQWQDERVAASGFNKQQYSNCVDEILNVVQALLGMP